MFNNSFVSWFRFINNMLSIQKIFISSFIFIVSISYQLDVLNPAEVCVILFALLTGSIILEPFA